VRHGTLLVKNSLTNIGNIPFSTAWYSHHFFTCDAHPVEYGYSLDVDLAATDGEYNEPGTWSWSTPLEDYAKIEHEEDNVKIEMQRGVESNVRIKAEFIKNDQSHGEFTLRACNTAIRETIPEVGDETSGISMYAFNLYIESGTFSPEPQILLHLMPGETASWTQQLDFEDDYPPPPSSSSSALNSLLQSITFNPSSSSSHRYLTGLNSIAIPAVAVVIAVGSVLFRSITSRGKRENYVPVPDLVNDDIIQ